MLSLIYIDIIKYEAGHPKAMFLLADMDSMRTSKVIVFGNGLEAYLTNVYLQKEGINVECFMNNDSGMSGKLFCGKPIVTLNDISRENYFVVIAMTQLRYNNEVLWQLKVHGYENYGLAFIETYHAFGGNEPLVMLQGIVLDEINKILCSEKKIEEVIRPVMNVGPAGNLLGIIPELCWTTTWSNCLLEWFYEQYKLIDKEYQMLEIGPGKGVFSAVVHQINPNIKIRWLMFDMDERSERPIRGGKYSYYPANQFEVYQGMIEEPDYQIKEKFDIIVMTEVMEHFVNNPVPTMKKIAGMLKEGGRLYLSTPDWGHLSIYADYREIPEYTSLEKYMDSYIGHTFQYNKQELEEILGMCDLTIEKYALSDSKNHNLIARHR